MSNVIVGDISIKYIELHCFFYVFWSENAYFIFCIMVNRVKYASLAMDVHIFSHAISPCALNDA